jgi:hypothetical protein
MIASVVTSQNCKLKHPLVIGKCLSIFGLGNIYYLPLNYIVFKKIMKQMERIHLQGELIHQEKTLKERVSPKTTQTLWFTKEHNHH